MASHGHLHTALYRATPSSGRSSAHTETEHHASTLGRRRKSPSPDTRFRNNARNESSSTKKRTSGTPLQDHPMTVDSALMDRGRKQKSKATVATQSRMALENAGPSGNHRGSQAAGRREKDRSRSRDGHVSARKSAHTHTETTLAASSKRDLQPERGGAFDNTIEMLRLQEKIDHLKRVSDYVTRL